jgi:hypothetical protein
MVVFETAGIKLNQELYEKDTDGKNVLLLNG